MRRFFVLAIGLAAACAASGQDVTMPPATQHAVLTVEGRGVQIYSCAKTGPSMQWVFVAPAARLFDKDGAEVGTHGDGPVWHLNDGSSVLGRVIARSASPDAVSVQWLLAKTVHTEGTGKLAGVEFIRRSETKGGVPADSCDAGRLGDIVRVPYTTTYTFYSSK